MGLLHFLEQLRVADDSCCVPHLTTRFVQPRDAAHDRALRHVRELCDLLKRLPNFGQLSTLHPGQVMDMTYHPLRPLIHDLDEPGLERAELLPRDLMPLLRALDALRESVDRRKPLLQLRRDDRLDVRLLLEYET